MNSFIIWFYVAMFLAIAWLKKIRACRVALNSIWFSADGNIPYDVIQNLIQLANDIKQSRYRKNYRLYFWTDTKKLYPQIKNTLSQHGIRIKNYRHAFLRNKICTQTHSWLDSLLALADANNRLFFVLASDIFRFYLLLKYYPTKRAYTHACYFDCNDINFNHLPDPRIFRKLKKIAFHFVKFNYTCHSIFHDIAACDDVRQTLLTNDVIITRNQSNNIFFNELFARYCENLNIIRHTTDGFIHTLNWTRDVMNIIDDDLAKVMIFTTTHMSNHLYVETENSEIISSLTFDSQYVTRKHIHELQDAEYFISFERDDDKGFTCLIRDKTLDAEIADDAHQQACRRFWYGLFQRRYALITATNAPIRDEVYDAVPE